MTFQTEDSSGQPIVVSIDVDGLYKAKTDTTGTAVIALPSGRHTVNVLFRDSNQSSSIVVSDDATVPLKLQLYQLDVQVLDDQGTPLDAQVYAGSDVLRTGPDGYVHFSNVTDSRLLLTVHYGQYTKELAVDLSSLTHAAVIFDLHAPSVSNLQSVFNGSTLQVRANVEDRGDYASGLAQGNSSVQLIYSFGSSPSTQAVPMYAAGYNLFEAYLQLPEGTHEVHYTVEASDAEGNLASSSDVFVAAVPKPAPPVEPVVPSVASKSWVEENSWVIAIFAILIVGACAYWYYLSRKPPSSAGGSAAYTYGKKDGAQAKSGPFSMPIKKTEQADSSSTDETGPALPKPQAQPASPNQAPSASASPSRPPSASVAPNTPPSASATRPPSSGSAPAPSNPPATGSASGSTLSNQPAGASASKAASKPSWAPPWAKMPGTSNKPNNAPPWAGRFGGAKTPSAPSATPPSAPASPAPSMPSAPSYPPAGPSMAPMPQPPSGQSMPPMPPSMGGASTPLPPSPPSTGGPSADSSNPAFGNLPGGKPKPPAP